MCSFHIYVLRLFNRTLTNNGYSKLKQNILFDSFCVIGILANFSCDVNCKIINISHFL